MALLQRQIPTMTARISNMDPSFDRPDSALARGVQITEFKESNINPEPVILEETEFLLEQYLSPRKLKLLAGVDDLEEVTSLELKVNTTDTSLGNFGALLPNLRQLKMSDSIVRSIRDIGSSLRGVSVLWMSQCGICEVDGISSMNSLQEVYLPYNEIADISPFSMLDELQILDIEGNNIDDIAQMQYLALCQKLCRLTIEGNPVCTARTPDSEEINYNYRDAVQAILPNIEILDDEPLIAGSQPPLSLNAFDKDWEYLEELQHDALLQSPIENDALDELDNHPTTAALRPATAFRPGSSLRPSSGFRPLSASRRPATISGRPSTSIRPTTAFAERPASSDAVDSIDGGGASDLTIGGVICGNPSRALRERRKATPTKTPDEHRACPSTNYNKYSSRDDLSDDDDDDRGIMNVVEELKEWRKEHNERMVKLEGTKCAQVLVVDHNVSDSSEEENSFDNITSLKTIDKYNTVNDTVDYRHSDKHDEVYDVDFNLDSDFINKQPSSSHRRIQVSSFSKSEEKQQKFLMSQQDTRFSKITIPVSQTLQEKPLPPTGHRSTSSRTSLPASSRIRRQLPQVPCLPSKPALHKS